MTHVASDHKSRSDHRKDDGVDRRRRLNERRDRNADEHEQNGIFDRTQYGRYGIVFRAFLLERQRAGHKFQPHKNQAERGDDMPDGDDLFVLGKHGHEHADGGKTEKYDGEIGTSERDNPRIQRRADVRAHDDRRRLKERHDTGIDEAHDHDRRESGTLAEHGDRRADAHSGNTALRRFVEHLLKFSVRQLGHVLREQFHAHEERPHAAQDLQDYLNDFPRAHTIILCLNCRINRYHYNKNRAGLSSVFNEIIKKAVKTLRGTDGKAPVRGAFLFAILRIPDISWQTLRLRSILRLSRVCRGWRSRRSARPPSRSRSSSRRFSPRRAYTGS